MNRLAVLAVLAAAVGCADEPPPDLHPLTGTVTHRGQPVTAGGLLFAPEEGGWGGVIVNANVEPDGSFAAQTEKVTGRGTTARPGIRPGRYKVTYNPPGDGAKTGMQCTLAEVVVVEKGGAAVALKLPEGDPNTPDTRVTRDDANPSTPPTGR